VLLALAEERDGGPDLEPWHALQRWLELGERRVTIPYATRLAEAIPPVAVRRRRDFGAVLGLIRAHALLHQSSRDRDGKGRIIATEDDYAVVRELIVDLVSEGVGRAVRKSVRETVAAVEALADEHGVARGKVAKKLKLDPSATGLATEGQRDRRLREEPGDEARQTGATGARRSAPERNGTTVSRETSMVIARGLNDECNDDGPDSGARP
jgi:hypothetical protein